MTTDPTTLSLADLAAAVVRLHRDTAAVHASQRPAAELDLLLAAANRLPGVVGERDAWQRNANAAKDALHESERRRAADLAAFEESLKELAAETAGMLDGVVVAKLATMSEQRDAAIRRADVIAEAARSVLALAEPLIAKHSGPYPASVVADLRAVLEQPGLVDSLYAAEVMADGCGRTARLEQERDTALARVAELEAELAKRNAKNEHNRPRIDAMLKIIDDTADADCAFGDGCPLGPVCLPCRARHLLPALETP